MLIVVTFVFCLPPFRGVASHLPLHPAGWDIIEKWEVGVVDARTGVGGVGFLTARTEEVLETSRDH